jgi:hypothetical protein
VLAASLLARVMADGEETQPLKAESEDTPAANEEDTQIKNMLRAFSTMIQHVGAVWDFESWETRSHWSCLGLPSGDINGHERGTGNSRRCLGMSGNRC